MLTALLEIIISQHFKGAKSMMIVIYNLIGKFLKKNFLLNQQDFLQIIINAILESAENKNDLETSKG